MAAVFAGITAAGEDLGGHRRSCPNGRGRARLTGLRIHVELCTHALAGLSSSNHNAFHSAIRLASISLQLIMHKLNNAPWTILSRVKGRVEINSSVSLIASAVESH